jgi:hypothetical protein
MSADDQPSEGRSPTDAPLRWATYVSENLIVGSEAQWAAEVEDILFRSRRWNAGVGVTGVLLMTDRHFVQVVEGPAPSFLLTLDRIRRDPRHRILRIEEHALEVRRFADWSMAYLGRQDAETSVLAPARHFRQGDQAAPVLLMLQYLLADTEPA